MPEDPPVYDPPPDPPIILSRSYLLFGAFGILHLVLAALFECLRMLNLGIGLLEIVLAVFGALAFSSWQKHKADWVAKQRARIVPQSPPAPR